MTTSVALNLFALLSFVVELQVKIGFLDSTFGVGLLDLVIVVDDAVVGAAVVVVSGLGIIVVDVIDVVDGVVVVVDVVVLIGVVLLFAAATSTPKSWAGASFFVSNDSLQSHGFASCNTCKTSLHSRSVRSLCSMTSLVELV